MIIFLSTFDLLPFKRKDNIQVCQLYIQNLTLAGGETDRNIVT